MLDLLTEKLSYYEMETGFQFFSSTTSNSNKFVSFLDKLNFWLSTNKIFKKKEVFVRQDNWSKHKTEQVLQKFKEMNCNVIFLLTYTPKFAQLRCDIQSLKEF